jgi:putative transposase
MKPVVDVLGECFHMTCHPVYHYFRQWKGDGTLERMNQTLRTQIRIADGRDAEPSAAILDSQSVKTTSVKGVRGYDAGKKVKGRKRHILVDTLGLLLIVADGGYAGKLIDWVLNTHNLVLEIVKRNDDIKGFQVLPRRWVVERTLAWLSFNRRLSKDYEVLPETSEAMVYVAMIRLMIRRLVTNIQPTGP